MAGGPAAVLHAPGPGQAGRVLERLVLRAGCWVRFLCQPVTLTMPCMKSCTDTDNLQRAHAPGPGQAGQVLERLVLHAGCRVRACPMCAPRASGGPKVGQTAQGSAQRLAMSCTHWACAADCWQQERIWSGMRTLSTEVLLHRFLVLVTGDAGVWQGRQAGGAPRGPAGCR